MHPDRFELPDEWVGSDVSFAFRGMIQAKDQQGNIQPAFINITGNLMGQTPSSVFFRTSDPTILGGVGEYAMPKDVIQGAYKIGNIAVVPKIQL